MDEVLTERDGTWVPSVPEPLWVGFRLRIAECECGARFKGHRRHRRPVGDHACTARERYQEHYETEHLIATPYGFVVATTGPHAFENRQGFVIRHAYARSPYSGAGNCHCGRPEDAKIHRVRFGDDDG